MAPAEPEAARGAVGAGATAQAARPACAWLNYSE